MGDFKEYEFELSMNDYLEHNFYLSITQKMVPRKCLRVVDQENDAPKRAIAVILGS